MRNTSTCPHVTLTGPLTSHCSESNSRLTDARILLCFLLWKTANTHKSRRKPTVSPRCTHHTVRRPSTRSPSCFTCAPPPSPPQGTWSSRGKSLAEDAAVCSILQKTRGNFHLPRGRDTAMHLGARGEASSVTPEERASHCHLSTLRAEHTPRGSARATARHPAHLHALHSRPPLRAGDPSPPAALEGARGPGTRSPSSSFSLVFNPLLLFLTSNWSSQNSR